MNRPVLGNNKVLDAVAAIGIGIPIYVGDYRHVLFDLFTTGNTNATIKMKASFQKGGGTNPAVDFNAAQTPTNRWFYVQMKNLADAVAVDGVTGVVLAGTDLSVGYEINTNFINWICPHVTAISAGAITGHINGANDAE